jgi:hypothetical protein
MRQGQEGHVAGRGDGLDIRGGEAETRAREAGEDLGDVLARALARGDDLYLNHGMPSEEPEKLLAGITGGSDDRRANFRLHFPIVPDKSST